MATEYILYMHRFYFANMEYKGTLPFQPAAQFPINLLLLVESLSPDVQIR